MISGYNWIRSKSSKPLPDNPVQAGTDNDGSPLFIGRTSHKNFLLICKIVPNKQKAYYAYDGKEHSTKEYEVLVGTGFRWVSSSNGSVPPDAVPGGKSDRGETLFIGRAAHSASVTPGQVHPSHGCLYIGHGGKEHKHAAYEVLVMGSAKSQWLPCNPNIIPPNAVRGGHDTDQSQILVGRIYHGGDLIPAKVVPSKGAAFCSYGGAEIPKTEFEVNNYYYRDYTICLRPIR